MRSLAPAVAGCALLAAAAPAELVVVRLGEGGAGRRAGIAPGDRLESWSGVRGSGTLEGTFSLSRLSIEEGPRGPVDLAGRRAGEVVRFRVEQGDWEIETRPFLSPDAESRWEDAVALEGDAAAEALAALAETLGDPRTAVDLLADGARRAASSDLAETLLDRAAERTDDPAVAAWLVEARGIRRLRDGDLDGAETSFRMFLGDRGAISDDPLLEARAEIWLGIVAWNRRDLETAEVYLGSAARTYARVAPGSTVDGAGQTNLGVLARNRGDLVRAERHARRAQEIFAAADPESLRLAAALNNLGVVHDDRGHFDEAEACYRRALEIRERLDPGGPSVAETTNNLGTLGLARHDWETARSWFRRSLEVARDMDPRSLDVARTLGNLGIVARREGDLATAERHALAALEIQNERAPESPIVASTLTDLASIALERGDLETARERLETAMRWRRDSGADRLDLAYNLVELGRLEEAAGDPAAAAAHFERALAIHESRAPGTFRAADAMRLLARVRRVAGRVTEAEDLLRRAVGDLAEQQRRLGGSPEALAEFRAGQQEVYVDLMDLLVEQGRDAEALGIAETARAGAFLAMLAARDVEFADLPEELDRERRLAEAETERLLGRLAAADEGEREAVRKELGGARRRQEAVRARIRREAPRIAAIRDPEPLDAAAVRRQLGPGDLLLSWSIGAERTILFAVDREEVEAWRLPVGLAALRRGVGILRNRVGSPARRLDPAISLPLARTLFGPAAGRLGAARRLVLVPDGPLWNLPFAVLSVPGEGEVPLVERLPMHRIASATVEEHLATVERTTARGATAHDLVLVGDPAREPADPRGFGPLAGSRSEVADIAGVWGGDPTVLQGEGADRGNVLAAARSSRILHLAVHGETNELFPLESGLALASNAEDDGILRAWEILGGLRIPSELVVLSSCRSGLGQTLTGEGVLGLARAFQIAGARAVVASLWDVPDAATSRLMVAFHEGLKEGLAKDEALRRAQLDLAEGRADGRFRHPFFWAGFQLTGDARPLRVPDLENAARARPGGGPQRAVESLAAIERGGDVTRDPPPSPSTPRGQATSARASGASPGRRPWG